MTMTMGVHFPTARSAEFLRFDEWTTSGLLVGVVGLVVFVGLISVLIHRFVLQATAPESDDSSMARPVLALVLVGTLVVLAAGSMSIGNTQTRNLLVGGVVSLASAAVAYYFSSKAATEARRDLLKATSGTAVPDLVGKTFDEAAQIISLTPLVLVRPDPVPAGPIKSQEPKAGTTAAAGTTMKLEF
jgi:hypothetical protein